MTLGGIVMLCNDEQFLKASNPIVSTLYGMVMLVKDEQLSKAEFPISVMLSGIMIFFNKSISNTI